MGNGLGTVQSSGKTIVHLGDNYVTDYQGSSTGITEGYLSAGSIFKMPVKNIPSELTDRHYDISGKPKTSLLGNDALSQSLYKHFLGEHADNTVQQEYAAGRAITAMFYGFGYTGSSEGMTELLTDKYLKNSPYLNESERNPAAPALKSPNNQIDIKFHELLKKYNLEA